jgi:hypothetical protein
MTLLHTRFRSILAAILIVGLGSALLIFLFAGTSPVDPLGDPGDSKMFVHDMLLYGGKANLLGSEFADWLGALWHGKRLAYTVAVLTLLLAAVFYYFFAPLPPESEASDETKH